MAEKAPTRDSTGVGGRSTNDGRGEFRRGLDCFRSSKLHSIPVSNLTEFQSVVQMLESERKCKRRPADPLLLLISTLTPCSFYSDLALFHVEPLEKITSSEAITWPFGSLWINWINCCLSNQIPNFEFFVSSKSNISSFARTITSFLILYSSCMPRVTAISNWSRKESPQTVTHNESTPPGSEPAGYIQFGDGFDKRGIKNIRLAKRNLETLAQAVSVASKTPPPLMGNSDTHTTSTAAWEPPKPFDVGFNNNITSDCHNFMSQMIESPNFKQCSPISMILLNSNSFFQVTKHLPRITALLDSACSAPVSSCTDLLNSYSRNLTSSKACASDLSRANPQIQSALLGLKSYRTLFTATCLHSSRSDTSKNTSNIAIHSSNLANNVSEGSYCFANAITNTTNPTNSYIYYLPLNVSLVGSAVPACNNCLQSTMSVFQQATANRSDVLASNYVKAASQINVVCGPQFVNASLVSAVSLANTNSAQNWSTISLLFIWLALILL